MWFGETPEVDDPELITIPGFSRYHDKYEAAVALQPRNDDLGLLIRSDQNELRHKLLCKTSAVPLDSAIVGRCA